jgi:hypothetical protein
MREEEVSTILERYAKDRLGEDPFRLDGVTFEGTKANGWIVPALEGNHWMASIVYEDWEQQGIDPCRGWYLVSDETGEVIPLMWP